MGTQLRAEECGHLTSKTNFLSGIRYFCSFSYLSKNTSFVGGNKSLLNLMLCWSQMAEMKKFNNELQTARTVCTSAVTINQASTEGTGSKFSH